SVLGYTQLLRREAVAPPQAEKLAIVESQVQRMIETIRSVLDRTRDRELKREPVAVDAVVSEALRILGGRFGERGLVLRSEVPSDLPRVPGDPVGLRQVLLNLLSNAIDATPTGGTITVRASALPTNGRGLPWLEVEVRDTGHGMTAEEVKRVFEPF